MRKIILFFIRSLATLLLLYLLLWCIKFEFDLSAFSLIPSRFSSASEFQQTKDFFGFDRRLEVSFQSDQLLHPQTLYDLNSALSYIKKIDQIEAVISLFDLIRLYSPQISLSNLFQPESGQMDLVREVLLKNPLIRGNLLDEQCKKTKMVITLKEPSSRSSKSQKINSTIQNLISILHSKAGSRGKFLFSGEPFLSYQKSASVRRATIFRAFLAILSLFILLFLLFLQEKTKSPFKAKNAFSLALLHVLYPILTTLSFCGFLALFSKKLILLAFDLLPILFLLSLTINLVFSLFSPKIKRYLLIYISLVSIAFITLLKSNFTALDELIIVYFLAFVISLLLVPLSWLDPIKKRLLKPSASPEIATIHPLPAIAVVALVLLSMIGWLAIFKLQITIDEKNLFSFPNASSDEFTGSDGEITAHFLIKGDLTNPSVIRQIKEFQDFLDHLPGSQNFFSIADVIAAINQLFFNQNKLPAYSEELNPIWKILDQKPQILHFLNLLPIRSKKDFCLLTVSFSYSYRDFLPLSLKRIKSYIAEQFDGDYLRIDLRMITKPVRRQIYLEHKIRRLINQLEFLGHRYNILFDTEQIRDLLVRYEPFDHFMPPPRFKFEMLSLMEDYFHSKNAPFTLSRDAMEKLLDKNERNFNSWAFYRDVLVEDLKEVVPAKYRWDTETLASVASQLQKRLNELRRKVFLSRIRANLPNLVNKKRPDANLELFLDQAIDRIDQLNNPFIDFPKENYRGETYPFELYRLQATSVGGPFLDESATYALRLDLLRLFVYLLVLSGFAALILSRRLYQTMLHLTSIVVSIGLYIGLTTLLPPSSPLCLFNLIFIPQLTLSLSLCRTEKPSLFIGTPIASRFSLFLSLLLLFPLLFFIPFNLFLISNSAIHLLLAIISSLVSSPISLLLQNEKSLPQK